MERELEVKVLNIDVDKMQEVLLEKGAEKIGVEYQVNHTFAPRGRDFENGYLRIREREFNGEKKPTEITYKETMKNGDLRVNNEFTTEISSVANMTKILEECGVYEKFIGKKKRISYSYRGQRFDIDYWDKSVIDFPYMEIEFTNTNLIDDILEDLGIDKENVTNESITDLRKRFNK